MNYEVVVTCAVTGAGDTVGRHPGVPVTPEQIADAAIEAARAGAAIAHIHVREPETGKGQRQVVEVEVNPLFVLRDRVCVIDAVMRVSGGSDLNWDGPAWTRSTARDMQT